MKPSPYRVLLVEDNPDHAQLVSLALMRGKANDCPYSVEHANTLADALRKLDASDYDIALLDLTLPDARGFEGLRALRERNADIPTIVLTSLADEETALLSLHNGAQDYLVKNEVPYEKLGRVIRYAVERHYVLTQNQQLLTELEMAKGLLEKKNRRLSELYQTAHQFVDNVSHEFRTPLTVIKEFSAILRDGLAGPVSGEQSEYLDIVLQRVDDLSTMVDDMLDISKLEAGMLGICREQCQVTDIIDRIRTTLERKAAGGKMHLSVDMAGDLPPVFCDPESIRRVIINLVVNALKFSREGNQVKVDVRRNLANSEAVVSVTDNGPGIASDNLRAIFQRFKQVDGSDRASTKGFGLGLNIAQELVHLNFREISVKSQLGSGSTFSFTIPEYNPAKLVRRYLAYLDASRCGATEVSLIRATAESQTEPTLHGEIAKFLHRQTRRYDIMFPLESVVPDTWLLVSAVGSQEVGNLLAKIEKTRADTNRNRPSLQLPPLALETIGSWRINVARMTFIQRFLLELQGSEAVHA